MKYQVCWTLNIGYYNLYIVRIPAPTGSPSIEDISHACNQTTVRWSPVLCTSRNGPLLHYNVTYYNSIICAGDMQIRVTTELFVVLTDISPYTAYCIQVARVNIGGVMGPFSGGSDTMTAQCR